MQFYKYYVNLSRAFGNLVCACKGLPGNEEFTEKGPQNLHMYYEATHLIYFFDCRIDGSR